MAENSFNEQDIENVAFFKQGHHFQHSISKVFVAVHDINPHWPGDDELGFGRHELTKSLMNVEFDETMQGQSCSMTLVPNKPYQEIIFPGDWISIYLGTGDESPEGFGVLGRPDSPEDNDRILVGFIDSVKETVMTAEGDGTTSVRILIHCSGIQKAFERTSIYYNEALGPSTLFGAQLPGLSVVTKNVPLIGTPGTIPRSIALAYLGFGGQFVLPSSYPKAEDEGSRKDRLISFLKKAKDIESDIGILNVRGTGTGNPQRKGVVQNIWEKHREKVQPNSITSIVDLFTYVEDEFLDGRITNSPNHDLTGSVWSKMIESVNPSMNECFFSMLPSTLDDFGDPGGKDEWGQSPRYVPSLVIREKPFSYTDDIFEVPSLARGTYSSRKVHFGDVFFSSVDDPVKTQKLQRKVIPPEPKHSFTSEKGIREASRVTGLSFDEVAYELDQSIRKKESTYKYFERLSRKAGRGTTLVGSLESQLFTKAKAGGDAFGYRYVDRVKIRPSDIQSWSIGIADNDLFNFFTISNTKMPILAQKYTFLQDGLIPIFIPESIRRYGLRVNEISTRYGNAGGHRLDSAAVQNFFARCMIAQDLWHQNGCSYRAGTITVPLMPKAHVGMVLDISLPWGESFYIEGVSHRWSHPGIGWTTFTVTRGQPTGLRSGQGRFKYAPPDAVRIIDLDTGKEVDRDVVPREAQPSFITTGKVSDDEYISTINGSVGGDTSAFRLDRTGFENIKKTAAQQKKEMVDYLVENGLISEKDGFRFKAINFAKLKNPKKQLDKRKVYTGVELKMDRLNAGRIAWVNDPDLRGMYDPIRRDSHGDNSHSESNFKRVVKILNEEIK
jgi:hypothetical protein